MKLRIAFGRWSTLAGGLWHMRRIYWRGRWTPFVWLHHEEYRQ